ncbi:MAG: 30S ribosomal protein S21 [Anaerolineae bacterium]|nr:30S ribosomal protein S21 [Anaerolineae bacterium]
MATVVLREGESQQNLLRRFRKKVAEGRVLSTVRKKRFYVSKSEQRRLAQRKAIRRERRRQWKQRRYR